MATITVVKMLLASTLLDNFSVNAKMDLIETDCTDVNDCAISDACNSATCFDTLGSFNCQHNDEYQKVGEECSDVNECELDNDFCDENASWNNTNGSYICKCEKEYFGVDTRCYDIN